MANQKYDLIQSCSQINKTSQKLHTSARIANLLNQINITPTNNKNLRETLGLMLRFV